MQPRPQRRKVTLDWQPKPKPAAHVCAHPGCALPGEHKAPKSREPRDGHLWFCLDHVREYNLAWDFFAGMSQAEIEAYQRRNVTWHRPTWKLGDKAAGPNGGENENVWVKDDLGLLGEAGLAGEDFGVKRRGPPPPKDPKERDALQVLDLKAGVSLGEIKRRFKALAKKHHPDTHGGDKVEEERFKRINQAYTYLLSCGYT
jgi:DnaJ-domain-containing protein 1